MNAFWWTIGGVVFMLSVGVLYCFKLSGIISEEDRQSGIIREDE